MAGTGPRMVYKAGVSAVTATAPSDQTTGDVIDQANGTWVYVYNGGNSDIAPTYGGTMITSGTSGYTVTVSSTVGISPCMGLAVNATLTTGTYGWLKARGVATFEAGADSSFAAGDMIVMDANGAFDDANTVSALSEVVICGQALSAIASGASGLGRFFCQY